MKKQDDKDELIINFLHEILDFLITEYSNILNVTLSSFPEKIATDDGVSSRTVYNWTQKYRKTEIVLREKSRNELAKYFSKAIPNIPPILFTAKNLKEFKEKLEKHKNSIESRAYPCFGIPKDKIISSDIKKLKKDILGIYVLYRFIFTQKGDNEFIREVIHIYEDNSDLKFNSYYTTGLQNDNYHSHFHGTALPIGHTINLSGTEWGVYQRTRTFLFAKDNSSFLQKKFLFGVLLSSNLDQNMPSAALVLLMRYTPHDLKEIPKNEIPAFAKKICKYRGDIIKEDFDKNHRFIKKLISNQNGKNNGILSPSRDAIETIFPKDNIHKNWLDKIKLSL